MDDGLVEAEGGGGADAEVGAGACWPWGSCSKAAVGNWPATQRA